MAQTREGAAKARAKKAGMSFVELTAREAAGEKMCWTCGEWRPRGAFNRDRTRHDGLHVRCQTCTRVKVRASRKGLPTAFKGQRHTAEARAAMSAARLGRPGPNKGGTISAERRRQISAAVRASPKLLRGADCHGYVDGKAAERATLRATAELKRWRFDVYARDNFTCQDCGDARGGNLHAHHIKPFATYPELRFELANGVTLCETCHKARHASGKL